MKFAPFLATALLILGSCAPKATMVEESDKPTAPAVAEKKQEEAPINEALPNFRPNDGLLDPSGLASMPTEKDMRPTVGPLDSGQSTVIATPPEKKETTSE
jgi:hypothetical protein